MKTAQIPSSPLETAKKIFLYAQWEKKNKNKTLDFVISVDTSREIHSFTILPPPTMSYMLWKGFAPRTLPGSSPSHLHFVASAEQLRVGTKSQG